MTEILRLMIGFITQIPGEIFFAFIEFQFIFNRDATNVQRLNTKPNTISSTLKSYFYEIKI